MGDFKVPRTTITSLQEELEAKGPSENLKLLFQMIRDLRKRKAALEDALREG